MTTYTLGMDCPPSHADVHHRSGPTCHRRLEHLTPDGSVAAPAADSAWERRRGRGQSLGKLSPRRPQRRGELADRAGREVRRPAPVSIMSWPCRTPCTCGNHTWRVRYRRQDNTIGAVNGFPTKAAATDHANTLESDQRQGSFIDPAAGKTTLADWSQDWLGALDVAIRNEDFYRSLLRRHILPRWGEHALADISGIKAAAWAKQLRDQNYARSR